MRELKFLNCLLCIFCEKNKNEWDKNSSKTEFLHVALYPRLLMYLHALDDNRLLFSSTLTKCLLKSQNT